MYFTAHPAEHYMWQVETKGQDKVDDLIKRSNQYHKKDRKAAYFYWKERLEELQND